jgi:hypothetical protein
MKIPHITRTASFLIITLLTPLHYQSVLRADIDNEFFFVLYILKFLLKIIISLSLSQKPNSRLIRSIFVNTYIKYLLTTCKLILK